MKAKQYCGGTYPASGGRGIRAGLTRGEILGQSGVTIATGVDLGQQTERGFAGLPETLTAKLRPYFGLKREAARTALMRQPLELREAEAGEIDALIHKRYIGETAALFGFAFEGIPKQAQAVAVSLHYQFGTPARKESPALAGAWEALRNGEYGTAAGLLENPDLWSPAHRAYLSRRQAEAALLREAA